MIRLSKDEQKLKDLRWIVAAGQYKQNRLAAIVNEINRLTKKLKL